MGASPERTLGNPLFAGFPRCARGRRPYGDSPKSRFTLLPLIARKPLKMRFPELSLDLIACENRRNRKVARFRNENQAVGAQAIALRLTLLLQSLHLQ